MKNIKTISLLAVIAAIVLTGCVSNTTPVPPCCYRGAVTTARLAALEITTEDGKRLKLTDALPGFTPEEGLFAAVLPFSEAEGPDFIYASLEPLLAIYDANRNGLLEKPEVLALYVREAIRATGTAVRHLGGDTPTWALSAANADVGGLVNWVDSRRGSMSPEGQAIFRDLDNLGRDLRTRGSDEVEPRIWKH